MPSATLRTCLSSYDLSLMVLTNKDDATPFSIANNFAICRHNNKQQATYDKSI